MSRPKEKDGLHNAIHADLILSLMRQEDAWFLYGTGGTDQWATTERTMRFIRNIPLMQKLRAKRAKRRRKGLT